jgi:hypothetical protein
MSSSEQWFNVAFRRIHKLGLNMEYDPILLDSGASIRDLRQAVRTRSNWTNVELGTSNEGAFFHLWDS